MTSLRPLVLSLALIGCSTSHSDHDAGPRPEACEGPAEAEDHCINSEFWKCRRDVYAGRITEAMYNECLFPIRDLCTGAAWPSGCSPSCAEANACVTLLSTAELATISTSELLTMYDDCNLCP